ncbi:MAG: hypothetical protein KKF46_01090 [Nanoarchaeota archaeon]|nr:hypothetical protein [Nanoarchaeota archaeon]MBU1320928.1 hypothetical protein [Nanoarchaeota archaeon]MBU1597547.1 hypothetical protein [Nanoarchaeota archaeon]MBU2441950.1 hypothetical protein [Nanoarchaeota archaeon]
MTYQKNTFYQKHPLIAKTAVILSSIGVLGLYVPGLGAQEVQEQVKKKEEIVQVDYTLEKRVNNSIDMSTNDMFSEVYKSFRGMALLFTTLTLDAYEKKLDEKQYKELEGLIYQGLKTMDAYPGIIEKTSLEYKNTMEPLLKELKKAQDKYKDTDSKEDWKAYDTIRDDIEERLARFTQEWDEIPDKISGTLNDLIENLNKKLEEIKKNSNNFLYY